MHSQNTHLHEGQPLRNLLHSTAIQTDSLGLAAQASGPVEGIHLAPQEMADLWGAVVDGRYRDCHTGIYYPVGRFKGGYFLFEASGVTTFSSFADFASCLGMLHQAPA